MEQGESDDLMSYREQLLIDAALLNILAAGYLSIQLPLFIPENYYCTGTSASKGQQESFSTLCFDAKSANITSVSTCYFAHTFESLSRRHLAQVFAYPLRIQPCPDLKRPQQSCTALSLGSNGRSKHGNLRKICALHLKTWSATVWNISRLNDQALPLPRLYHL